MARNAWNVSPKSDNWILDCLFFYKQKCMRKIHRSIKKRIQKLNFHFLVIRFRNFKSNAKLDNQLTSFNVNVVPLSGPFGEQDDEQVFVQKVVPETDQLFVRLASNGKRVCIIQSVDGSVITSFCVHECEGSSRMGSRPRRFIFTGHSNGAIQMWDLTTALDHPLFNSQSFSKPTPFIYNSFKNISNVFKPMKNINSLFLDNEYSGGPTPEELWKLLDQCELSNSHCSTPCISPCPLTAAGPKIKASNVLFLNQSHFVQDPNAAAPVGQAPNVNPP